ncbi:hypothetical protein [Xylanimonas ulmi]|uniref:RAMA domain-containing protein n=1 Tax=Xylanimonas ulmi TaxID=228973 RepID=A0A4Q7M474_9MICO|nr:hypothetical protein [Xylanibacterium ulmi]RZS62161.1 hypothetical protein EV386_2480 [Xylanibacterium ulmi]
MPLFEVERDRPQLVKGADSGVGTTAHRVVDSHIDGLLGEQVFPVCPGSGPDEPHLLALDASGAPVVVELVARLDDDALSRALDHAGAAGRMTRGQLAALYPAGPQEFQRDVATFYDSVPVRRSQPGRGGARLIVICQEAEERVLNAVDFLRQPSMPVEVLRIGVVHGNDGRRFVDVSPLVIHPASAPDRPQIVQAPSSAVIASPAATGTQATAEDVAVVADALSRSPQGGAGAEQTDRLDPVPLPGVPTSPPAASPAPERATPAVRPVRRRSRTDRFSNAVPVAHAADAPAPSTAEPAAAPRPDTAPVTPPVATTPVPPPPAPTSPVPPPPAPMSSEAPAAPTPPEAAHAWLSEPAGHAASVASDPDRAAIAFGEVFAVISSPLDPHWPGAPGQDEPSGARWEAPFEPPRLRPAPAPEPWWQSPAPEPQPGDATSPSAADEEVDADLAALAVSLGVPTRLVWERPRRGQRFEATLHPDGVIELADGGRYRHPDAAASAVSGSPAAQGWSVWRLGSGTGRTLTEEFRARFA